MNVENIMQKKYAEPISEHDSDSNFDGENVKNSQNYYA